MGIDPSFGSSDFAVVGQQVKDGKVEILHCDSINRPTLSESTNMVYRLIQYHIGKVYVDSSAAEFISELKSTYGEYRYYEYLDSKIVDAWIRSPVNNPKIVPVNFRTHGKPMLNHLINIMQSRLIRIDPKFDAISIALSIALRTAKYNGDHDDIDKTETSYDDVLDALRLSLLNVRFRKT